MKNFLIICSIFIFAYLVRFYNYENRIIFWTEQAKSLQTSLGYLDKPSLLGQEYFRQDSNFHTIYSGALFNYALLPIILFSHYDVLRITIFFGFINILTGLLVFLTARRFFGMKTAMFSSILFLFNSLMIYHSLFIWNYNLLPAVGILIFLLIFKNNKEHKLNNFFWLGLLCGIGISIQILFVVYALITLLISLIKSRKRILSFMLFVIGLIIGNLPMLIFDIRHNFYEVRTIWQYFIDTLYGTSDAGFAYYYLLPLIPVIAIAFGYLLSKINYALGVIVIATYLFFNINIDSIKNPKNNLTVADIDTVSKTIVEDSRGEFNVASVIDFDKRAYALRYFLKYKYEKTVMAEDDYKNPKLLYVLATNNFDFKSSDTWEIKANWPYKVTLLKKINSEYSLYKLTK